MNVVKPAVVFLSLLTKLISSAEASSAKPLTVSTRCEISQPYGERSRSIVFPDGRELAIIGHDHGHRGVPMQLKQITSDPSKTNDQFSTELKSIVQSNSDAVAHANADLPILRKLLADKPQFKFVAVEDTPDGVPTMYPAFQTIRAQLSSEISRRGLRPNPFFQPASLILSGVPMYLAMTEPGLMKNRTLVGLESTDATNAERAAYAEQKSAIDALRIAAKENPKYLKDIEDTRIQLFHLYATYDPAHHDDMVLTTIRKHTPESFQTHAERVARAELAVMKATKARDTKVAEGMIQNGNSGVLFVGQKHLDSIAKLVQTKCASGATDAAGGSRSGAPSSLKVAR